MKVLIGFSYRRTLLGKLIKFFTNSQASHVFIADKNKQLVSHSYGIGVHIVSLEQFIKTSTVIEYFEVDVPAENLDWLWRQHGKAFNWLNFIYLSVVFVLRKVGITINFIPKWSEDSYTCTELVSRVLGLDQRWSVSPQLLYKTLKEDKSCPSTF